MTNIGEVSHQMVSGGQTVEERVASLFGALLPERPPTGSAAGLASDDFFERGGNSMLAARLVASLRREFEVDVSIRDVFRGRTVAAISQAVRNRLGVRS
ncbi:MAG TPA: phosphopantetheine-binding protein [Streptosporangiaceae bacterium]|nr:phosphopantetheine-binding protein [Streptosporangiaceae bacterium]